MNCLCLFVCLCLWPGPCIRIKIYIYLMMCCQLWIAMWGAIYLTMWLDLLGYCRTRYAKPLPPFLTLPLDSSYWYDNYLTWNFKSKSLLNFQTRVFVTNSLTYLPQVDQIVVLKNGEISEIGGYHELISHNGPFAEFIATYLNDVEEEGEDSDKICKLCSAKYIFHSSPFYIQMYERYSFSLLQNNFYLKHFLLIDK